MCLSSVVFQGTVRIRRRQYESSCRCLRKDKRPALFGSSEEGGGEHQSSAVAKGTTALDYCVYRLDREAKDSGLPKGVEYPSERAWIVLAAVGIGMAQTSNVSTHHARRA